MQPKIKQIEVTEYGTVYIRKPSAAMRLKLNSLQAQDMTDDARSLEAINIAVSYGMVDEHGKRIYTDERIEELRDLDAAFLDAVFNEIMRFGNLVTVEGATKNSAPSPSDLPLSA